MKIVFAGTAAFALPSLAALVAKNYQIVGVYTQPDRPKGRGLALQASVIKQFALTKNLTVFQPKTLRDATTQAQLQALQPDVMVVAAYGLLLPKAALDIPRLACVNVHASLLPRWRGAAPIQHAILAGDAKTGVTIMQMDQGLDTGAILNSKEISLAIDETSASLTEKLAALGASALIETVAALEKYLLHAKKQNNLDATHAAKIQKSQAKLNFSETATMCERKVRAFNPAPIAFFEYENLVIRVWQAHALNQAHAAPAGSVLNITKHGLDVACGQHILRIEKIQLPGKKPVLIQDFMNAKPDFFKGNLCSSS